MADVLTAEDIPQDVQEFFKSIDMCQDGYRAMFALGNYGLTFDEAANRLEERGYPRFAAWVREKKNTPEYVHFYGKEVTVSYNVFNPLTGTHTEYSDEASAREAVIEVSKQILAAYPVNVVEVHTNENGDSAWVPTTLTTPINIS